MNAYTNYPVLTFFIVDQPIDVVVDGWWHDSTVREPDFAKLPNYLRGAAMRAFERSPVASSYLCRRSVLFDLGWTYRLKPLGYDPRDNPVPALFWSPMNAPAHTAVMVDCLDGHPTLMGPSLNYHDWQFFWTYIDDGDRDASVCRFEYSRNREEIHREVWVGLDTENERKPKWRIIRGGPVQSFEKPNDYQAAQVQDRLTRSSIADYCMRMGCDITSDEFWTSNDLAWVIWSNLKGTYRDPPYRKE